MGSEIREELARARERLLDLTLRNRLLNFRPTKRTTVRIVDELPASIWSMLVDQDRSLAFLAREEHERIRDGSTAVARMDQVPAGEATESRADEDLFEGQSFSLPALPAAGEEEAGGEAEEPARRHVDRYLQTALAGEALQTNLLRIYRAANSALSERGVNLLFLAMGFVEWRQPADADRLLLAPLLLVPVVLDRTSARRRFKLSASDEDPVINPCLAAMLQRDFDIELPPEPESWEDFDVDGYLAQAGAAIAGQAGWRVAPEMVLGLFSFTKYLMYVDMDPDRWPEDRPLTGHPLIRAMCGEPLTAEEGLFEPASAGRELPPEEVFQVVDADSSQQQAIQAAKAGASFVLEGPPGTGKSQTITNLIAECLAAGRTVLFVSEKMAALEVVKRRLDKVGLGEFCLELHSTKANRRAVAAELAAALEKGRSGGGRTFEGADRLQRVRDRLNAFVRALHAPLGAAGLTAYDAMGRVALLKEIPDVDCEMPGVEHWTAEDFGAYRDAVRRLGRTLEAVGPVDEHPFRGCRLTAVTGSVQRSAKELLGKLTAALECVRATSAELAGMLGAGRPATIDGARRSLQAARVVGESPEPEARLLSEDLWDEPSDEARSLLETIREYTRHLGLLKGRYTVESLEQVDWPGMAERCDRYWWSFTRWFRPAYWRDRKALKLATAPEHHPDKEERKADLKRLARAAQVRGELAAGGEVGGRYFGPAWRGAEGDWDALLGMADWLRRFRTLIRDRLVGAAGIERAGAGGDRAALAAAVESLAGQLAAWEQSWTALRELLKVDDPGLFDASVAETGLDELHARLARMAEAGESLFAWGQYQEALQACQNGPLADFVDKAAHDRGIEPEVLALAMDKQYHRLLAEAALAEREPLRSFSGGDYEAHRLEFARLDRQWVATTRRRLTALLASERPDGRMEGARSSQLGILQGEVRRKRGGRSIRRLLTDAADVIGRLKPCFMMSPLSVAQFLDAGGLRFDVVVFDEASQVEPADALGAIARGGQLVLVGDSKQLPPTSFFSRLGGEGDGGEAGEGAAGIADMESILDRGEMSLPRLRLRWHYRSRHESLISFSNRRFYDGDLVVFPSSHADTPRLGLSMVYEPGDLYDRGRGQTNHGQARRIAEWVFRHARGNPTLSLGVGAFSQRQQQAIWDEIERLRVADDSLEEFFDRNKDEPFFVKNLETIQGDERDVILLSVGYGLGGPGERLSMNFGPLNQDGGWRRMNVLITRARRRCVVFSSIRGEDFDLSATDARGVHALKGYLDYARTGILGDGPGGGAAAGGAFEQAVYNALTERGVKLDRHVGWAGSAIDMAVVDPDRPGRYVLGIECDGAVYRDAVTARDRDRGRPGVLEGLGWRIHRVWATDWFRTPTRELERAIQAIERARAGRLPAMTEAIGAVDVPEPATSAEGEGEDTAAAVPTVPYEQYVTSRTASTEAFYTCPIEEIAGIVAEAVEVEGPIHRRELSRRVCAAWGITRLGSRVERRIDLAVAACLAERSIVDRQGFCWPAGMTDPPIRRRDGDARDIDLICPEEIALAARLLLKAQFGMDQADLVTQTARLLGFARAGDKVTARVNEIINADLDAGRIERNGQGNLIVPSDV